MKKVGKGEKCLRGHEIISDITCRGVVEVASGTADGEDRGGVCLFGLC